MVADGTWNWSGQAITWYFTADKRAVIGNGTNYKLIYNANLTNYQIADDVNSKEFYFICEYQGLSLDSFCHLKSHVFL